jgi:hypothetical protein
MPLEVLAQAGQLSPKYKNDPEIKKGTLFFCNPQKNSVTPYDI